MKPTRSDIEGDKTTRNTNYKSANRGRCRGLVLISACPGRLNPIMRNIQAGSEGTRESTNPVPSRKTERPIGTASSSPQICVSQIRLRQAEWSDRAWCDCLASDRLNCVNYRLRRTAPLFFFSGLSEPRRGISFSKTMP